MLERLRWYARRLSRMSPPEIAHRVGEQAHRWQDRRARFGWERFGGWSGDVAGLTGFHPERVDGLKARAEASAAEFLAGRLRFLSQDWPEPSRADWWRDPAIWFLDPVTGKSWGGAERFAFDVPYRHDHERGDVKFVWEINRLQFLPVLALGGRPDAAWAALASWMDANPPYQGINWTGGIEAASRLASALALVAVAPPSGQDLARLRAFSAAHVHWIERYPSKFSSANNHRVAELSALVLATTAAPTLPRAAAIKTDAMVELEREVLIQFHPDGVGAEQSPTYAAYSLEWCVLAGVAAGPTLAYRARIKAAAEALLWFADDGGRTPRIGDDDEGRVLSLCHTLEDAYPASVARLALRWLGEPVPEMAAPAELRDAIAPEVPAGAAPPLIGERTFDEGGYTVSRRPSPRGTAVLVFDHAPLGFLSIAAHGHADALALWLHWGEEAVIADAGTYLYHSGGAWRDRLRGTGAHNTLAIEGRDQSRIAGAFNWSAHATARLVERAADRVAAEHDGYRAGFGVMHRRTVSGLGGARWRVVDALVGQPRGGAERWRLGFTLGPRVTVQVDGPRATAATPQGRRVVLTSERAPWRMEDDAPYSPAFNVLHTAHRLVLEGRIGERAADGQVADIAIELVAP